MELLDFTVLDPEPVLLPQLPKPDWHPVPQYEDVVPHQPPLLQQLPKELPKQVYPLVPPHVASGVTFFVGVDTGAEDARVDEERMVDDAAFEDEAGLEVVPLPVHVPKAELQPVPQWSVDEPHHPYLRGSGQCILKKRNGVDTVNNNCHRMTPDMCSL